MANEWEWEFVTVRPGRESKTDASSRRVVRKTAMRAFRRQERLRRVEKFRDLPKGPGRDEGDLNEDRLPTEDSVDCAGPVWTERETSMARFGPPSPHGDLSVSSFDPFATSNMGVDTNQDYLFKHCKSSRMYLLLFGFFRPK